MTVSTYRLEIIANIFFTVNNCRTGEFFLKISMFLDQNLNEYFLVIQIQLLRMLLFYFKVIISYPILSHVYNTQSLKFLFETVI
jgi:hypothetical protein